MSSASRPKSFRRFIAVLLGIASLVAVEIVLRLAGVLPPDRPVRSLFSPPTPVFERQGDYYRTAEHVSMYFPATKFPAKKARGITRIFMVGGSSAMGFPIDDIFGPRQLISKGLKSLDPEGKYRVINAAGYAYASYEALDVVEEVLKYDPDIIVVMTGHNDFLEPRFASARAKGRFAKAVKSLRVYRLLRGLVEWSKGEFGTEKWAPHTVTPRERKLVREDFRETLDEIVKLCEEKGVNLVLVTMPSNTKDYRPFGPSAVSEKEKIEIDKKFKEGDFQTAEAMIGQYKEKAPGDAWLMFEEAWLRWAMAKRLQAGLASGGTPAPEKADETSTLIAQYKQEAARLWIQAKDKDPWPIRASSAMNDILRQTADEYGVSLADVAKEIKKSRRPYKVAGARFFFDHCHLNQRGQRILARMVIEAMAETGEIELPKNWEARTEKVWDSYRNSIPQKAWAQGYFVIANETGENMGRVFRGLRYADMAVQLDSSNPQALELEKELKPLSQKLYPLTGD